NDLSTCAHLPLSLHDALPIFVFIQTHIQRCIENLACFLLIDISHEQILDISRINLMNGVGAWRHFYEFSINDFISFVIIKCQIRSEEHTSELQSRENFVCRLL